VVLLDSMARSGFVGSIATPPRRAEAADRCDSVIELRELHRIINSQVPATKMALWKSTVVPVRAFDIADSHMGRRLINLRSQQEG